MIDAPDVDPSPQRLPDAAIAAGVTLAAGVGCHFVAQSLPPELVTTPQALDAWFDADPTRVFTAMTERWTVDSLRSHVHPLFTLIAYPPTYALRQVFGLDPMQAVHAVSVATAGLWGAALFAVLRAVGCLRLDALLLTLLGLASSASLLFLTVPETYGLGSLSIMAALGLVAATRRTPSSTLLVAVSACTLSITTTNWMAGILATILNRPWRPALQITVNAFAAVSALWALQHWVFRYTVFFLQPAEEQFHAFRSDWLSAGRSFFFHSMVIPDFRIVELCHKTDWPCLLTQESAVGSSGAWGAAAGGLWIALLALGAWGFVTREGRVKLRLLVGFTLAGQMALHSLYGAETILYSLDFLPLLLVVAAFGFFTRARWVAVALACSLLVAVVVNNAAQFSLARDVLLSEVAARRVP